MSLLADPLNDLGGMQYLTPRLYLEINSGDADVVERASDRGEKAIVTYKKHLAEILKGKSSELRRLGSLSLHDWELIKTKTHHDVPAPGSGSPPVWYSAASLVVRHEKQSLWLLYLLWNKVQRIAAPRNWTLSKDRVHWLYDEVDAVGNAPDRFVHRVLLSNGSTLVIPFSTFFLVEQD
jgi:hypothetical protein